MKVFDIAFYYQGQYGMKNVKFATIIAPDLNSAKTKWMTTDSKALILDDLCKELTKENA